MDLLEEQKCQQLLMNYGGRYIAEENCGNETACRMAALAREIRLHSCLCWPDAVAPSGKYAVAAAEPHDELL